MKRTNQDETTTLSAVRGDRLFPLLGTVLLLAGALFVAIPVFSALPACLPMEGASASGCIPGGSSIFNSLLPIWESSWVVVGIALGVVGVGLRFNRRFS